MKATQSQLFTHRRISTIISGLWQMYSNRCTLFAISFWESKVLLIQFFFLSNEKCICKCSVHQFFLYAIDCGVWIVVTWIGIACAVESERRSKRKPLYELLFARPRKTWCAFDWNNLRCVNRVARYSNPSKLCWMAQSPLKPENKCSECFQFDDAEIVWFFLLYPTKIVFD